MQASRPTIADVARAAGVSKGLVSFALNGRPGVSPESRTRILAAADELGWSPSIRARALSSNQSFAVGLVIARDPEIIADDSFFPSFISGVEQVLAPRSQSLVLSVVADEGLEESTYRRLAAERRVDGVILTDLRSDDSRISLLRDIGLPAVSLGRPDVDAGAIPAITLDDAPAIHDVVRHLVDLGHSRIAHVAGPARMLHAGARKTSFLRAMASFGLAEPLVVETNFSAADGARATSELLNGPARPTAIVYANDAMAIAGLGAARRAGLDVPGDLSIVGFDDSAIGRYIEPALATVATDAMGWGFTAADALLRLVGGEDVGDIELAPADLVIRASTAPAPDEPLTDRGGSAAARDRRQR